MSCKIAVRWTLLDHIDDIHSGSGLVMQGNRLLPDPLLTQNFVAIYIHQQQ